MTVVPMPKRARANDKSSLAAEAAKPKNAIAKPYEPTAQELAAQAAYRKRRDSKRPIPKMKIAMSEDGQRVVNMSVDHPAEGLAFDLLGEALGADNEAFLMGTIDSAAKLAQTGSVINEVQMNYALSMVASLKPKDQIEATLGVQMAAIHIATMNAAASLGGSKTREVQEMHERALNRLSRTFVAQVEALKRYRSKGEQRVIVERVNVEKGGQAIVGNVAHGGGVDQENDR